VVVLEAVLSEAFLDQDLLGGAAEEVQLDGVEVARGFYGHIPRTFRKQPRQLLGLLLRLGIILLQRVLQRRNLLPHLQQLPLTYCHKKYILSCRC